MSVYVDSMKARFGRMIMCHMNADTTEELLAMADKIGVARKWIQKPGHPVYEHFDICMAKRALAVRFGAVEITMREAGELLRNKRARDDAKKAAAHCGKCGGRFHSAFPAKDGEICSDCSGVRSGNE